MFTATEGAVTAAPDVKLDRAGSVTGRVTSAAGGAPVTGGTVGLSAFHPGPGQHQYVQIGADGSYTFPALGPYAWPLLFSTGANAPQWSGGTGTRSFAQKIQVTAGGTTRYDIALAEGAAVTGRAPDDGGWIVATICSPATSWASATRRTAGTR